MGDQAKTIKVDISMLREIEYPITLESLERHLCRLSLEVAEIGKAIELLRGE